MPEQQKKCERGDCVNQARMSIKTSRPSRARVYSTVDYDERAGLKTGEKLCKQHGKDTMSGLIDTLVDEDEEFDDA